MEMPTVFSQSIASRSGLDLKAMANEVVNAKMAAQDSVTRRQEQQLNTQREQLLGAYNAAGALSQATRALIQASEKVHSGYSLKVSSSTPERVAVRINHQPLPGTWMLVVRQMASPHSLVGDYFAPGAALGEGTLHIRCNGDNWLVNLFNGRGLYDLARAIQLNTAGQVQASVLNDLNGQRLLLTTVKEGSLWRIQASGSGSGADLAAGLREWSPAADGEVLVNGVATKLKSNSNQPLINGLRLDIKQADPVFNILIRSEPDYQPMLAALQNFLDSYNQLKSACDPRDENGLSLDRMGTSSVKNLARQIGRILSQDAPRVAGQDRQGPGALPDLGVRTEKNGQLSLFLPLVQQWLEENPRALTGFLLGEHSPVRAVEQQLLSVMTYGGTLQQKATDLGKKLQALALDKHQQAAQREALMRQQLQVFAKMDHTMARNRQLRDNFASFGGFNQRDNGRDR